MTKQNGSFNKALKFLPKIDHKAEEEKAKNLFPNRKNLHFVKQTYSKYLTNSKKENFVPNFIDLTPAATNISKINQQINENREYEKSSYFGSDLDRYENQEKSSFYSVDLKKFNSIEKRFNSRSKSNLLKPIENKQPTKISELDDDELKYIYNQTPAKSQLKHVIDLNFVSSHSRLSEHYMRPYSINLDKNEQCLSDMNLNEMWPNSNMIKTATKSNNWINTFKAKTIANEINKNYNELVDPSSRLEFVSLMPNNNNNNKIPNEIRNDSNLRINNNNNLDSNAGSRLDNKKYTTILPDLKIAYCQKQMI